MTAREAAEEKNRRQMRNNIAFVRIDREARTERKRNSEIVPAETGPSNIYSVEMPKIDPNRTPLGDSFRLHRACAASIFLSPFADHSALQEALDRKIEKKNTVDGNRILASLLSLT